VHFSDYDFVDERHFFPTDGKINWVHLIRKLYGCGYTGPWIYECGKRERTFQMCYDLAAGILKEAGVPEIII
jgi:sugar phosphate isomerase/epimerase